MVPSFRWRSRAPQHHNMPHRAWASWEHVPKLTYHAPLFQLDFAVNKDTSLQVLKRRQKVLCEFRHCLVCESPCQKKTNSGWEIVGDKHTAVPSSGGGWERYPSCADQTLTAGEVKKRVKARGMKHEGV